MATYKNGVLVPVAPATHEGTHVDGGTDDIDSALATVAIPNHSAIKITSDRLASILRLPVLTTDKVWKGVAGVPAEADEAGGVAFTELVGGENHCPTANATWQDWDVSAIVPAGTVAVLVYVVAGYEAHNRGARKNGSALARLPIPPSAEHVALLTECDANRVIEIYGDNNGVGADDKFSVIGYWS